MARPGTAATETRASRVPARRMPAWRVPAWRVRTRRAWRALTLCSVLGLGFSPIVHAEAADSTHAAAATAAAPMAAINMPSSGSSALLPNHFVEDARAARAAKAHRDRTIAQYGVTSQEEIDRCVAENADRVFPAIYHGYDYPCPAEPITAVDVEELAARQARERAFGWLEAPARILGQLGSVLKESFGAWFPRR